MDFFLFCFTLICLKIGKNVFIFFIREFKTIFFLKTFQSTKKKSWAFLSWQIYSWSISPLVCFVLEPKHTHNPRQRFFFLNYKTEWNKTLKGLEQFRKQTPFFSIVPLPCCGYFSMPSMGSTLWLLITYPFKLLPPETRFSLLYLRRSVSTYQQLQRGASAAAEAANFFHLLNTLMLPFFFAAQALYCSFIDWEVLCCSGINSWGDPSPTISLSVRPLWLKGGEAA